MKFIPFCSLLFLFACAQPPEEKVQNNDAEEIDWLPYDQAVFDLATSSNKLILLEVGANWCHWCHVMDDSTYANPEVQSFLKEHFILSREDQDSRPDLFAAYRPWGWPAIIVQNEKGEDLLRLKGYQPRKKFLAVLQETIDHPTIIQEEEKQKKEFSASASAIAEAFKERVDHEKGAYPWKNKFIQFQGILQGLKMNSDPKMKAWTDLTIKNSYALVDPVWSGVYQYSALRSWNNQHYEKLLKIQAEYIKTYAVYAAFHELTEPLEKAESIVGYCERFFADESGLYYNSQNADVVAGEDSEEYYQLNETERLLQGTPSVDQSIYLKENAKMGEALLYLWAATDNKRYLEKAQQMLDILIEERYSKSGLYLRSEQDEGFYAFEDNRNMLEVLMHFYQLSGDKKYLKKAKELGLVMQENFFGEDGFTAVCGEEIVKNSIVDLDNINGVITFNKLGHLANEKEFLTLAQRADERCDKAELNKVVGYLPLLQMAEEQLAQEPFHAVFLHDGQQSQAGQNFYKQLILHPSQYITFEWLDVNQMNEEQQMMYGGLPAGTLFMCTSSFCSAPMYEAKDLADFLASI